MELSTFITETLTEIQKGVADAIAARAGETGAINPCFGGVERIGPELVQKVSFDVAVTVTEKSSISAGGGIKIAVARIGADGSETSESSNVSRIQFAIPVIPPVQIVAYPEHL